MNHRDLPLRTPSRIGARIRGGIWLAIAAAGGTVLVVVVFDAVARVVIWW